VVGDFTAANAMFCWWFTGCADWDRSDTAAATRILPLVFYNFVFLL